MVLVKWKEDLNVLLMEGTERRSFHSVQDLHLLSIHMLKVPTFNILKVNTYVNHMLKYFTGLNKKCVRERQDKRTIYYSVSCWTLREQLVSSRSQVWGSYWPTSDCGKSDLVWRDTTLALLDWQNRSYWMKLVVFLIVL